MHKARGLIQDGTIVAGLMALTLLFFWPALTPEPAARRGFLPGDFTHQFWAFAAFQARELAAGRPPLWNPFAFAGSPFWADPQSAPAYPPRLLTTWGGALAGGLSLFALQLEAIAHFLLTAVCTYLFVRRLTGSRPAGALAALVFTFSGYLTSYPPLQLAILETVAWLPLLLYLLDAALVERPAGRLRGRPRAPALCGAGLAWGLALLAAHPQSALMVGYTAAAYALFLGLGLPSAGGWRGRASALAGALAASLAGVGLAAIQLLPALEYMLLSNRLAGNYADMAGGFPPRNLLQFFLPGSVGIYSPLYVGALPLLLGIWAVGASRRREALFWAGAALLALLLSLGDAGIVYRGLYAVAPGFSLFRDQERWAGVVAFALATLAGYGAAAVWPAPGGAGAPAPARGGLAPAASWLALAAIALFGGWFRQAHLAGWDPQSLAFQTLSQAWSRTLLFLALTGLAWAALSLWRARRPARPAATLALLGLGALIFLDLWRVNGQNLFAAEPPAAATAMPAAARAIREDAPADAPFRVQRESGLWGNFGVAYAIEETWGASPLRLRRYQDLYTRLRAERLWELLDVRYVVTWRQTLFAPSDIIYQEERPDGETVYVHRLHEAGRRAWLTHRVRYVADEALLTTLDSADFQPYAEALMAPGVRVAVREPPAGAHESVEIIERRPGYLALDVTAAADGLCVLSEIMYPGWKAELDGAPAEILTVNGILRGVATPAGRHRLVLRFRPRSVVWGAALSALALAGLLVGAASGRRRRAGRLARQIGGGCAQANIQPEERDRVREVEVEKIVIQDAGGQRPH